MLIVAAGIGIALSALGILLQLLGMGMAGMQGLQGQNAEAAQMIQMFSGGIGIVVRVIGILVGIFIIYGRRQNEKARESRPLHRSEHRGHDSLPFALLLHWAAHRNLGADRAH